MKPPRRYGRRARLPGLAFAALLVIVLAAGRYALNRHEAPPSRPADSAAVVQRVVDGDTLLLTSGERVRLVGVDAPETVKEGTPVEPWGPEASRFTRQFTSGGTIRLQFDHQRHDRFGRLLAYVWVGDRLLNEELLRAGLARFERHYSYSPDMKRRFAAAEREARDGKRGIWSGR